MGWAWSAVAVAAVLSGTASVLQARVARRTSAERLHATVALRLLRERTYVLSLVLVATGFGLSFIALRLLPVFVVQAGRSSSLAVAAFLATRLLGSRLRRPEWSGLTIVAAGLVLLAWSTATVTVHPVAATSLVLVLAAATVGVAGAWVASRPATRTSGILLATLAGGGFAVLAGGVHTLGDLRPTALVAAPAAWASAVGGGLALLLSALAFQRAPAVAVTAVVTSTETIGGALLGLLLAGDHAAPGRGIGALTGFVLVVLGSSLVAGLSVPDAGPTAVARPARRTQPDRSSALDGAPGAREHLVHGVLSTPAEEPGDL